MAFLSNLSYLPQQYVITKSALNSKYFKEVLRAEFDVHDIFEIVDIDMLWNLYIRII